MWSLHEQQGEHSLAARLRRAEQEDWEGFGLTSTPTLPRTPSMHHIYKTSSHSRRRGSTSSRCWPASLEFVDH